MTPEESKRYWEGLCKDIDRAIQAGIAECGICRSKAVSSVLFPRCLPIPLCFNCINQPLDEIHRQLQSTYVEA